MKYRTQSANVLNEADRFENILEWRLFSEEQTARLWSGDDWVPGDPLFMHPQERYFFHDDDMGECPREMVQIIDPPGHYTDMRCQDCAVSWGGAVTWGGHKDNICWNCGKEVRPKYQDYQGNKSPEWNRAMGIISRYSPSEAALPDELRFQSRVGPERAIGQILDVEMNADGFIVSLQVNSETMLMSMRGMSEAANVGMSRITDMMDRMMVSGRRSGLRWRQEVYEASLEYFRVGPPAVVAPQEPVNCGERYGDQLYNPMRWERQMRSDHISLPVNLDLTHRPPPPPELVIETPPEFSRHLETHSYPNPPVTEQRRPRNV